MAPSCVFVDTNHARDRQPQIHSHALRSVKRNETETKQFQNSFETVLFQFHFVLRTVYELSRVLSIFARA